MRLAQADIFAQAPMAAPAVSGGMLASMLVLGVALVLGGVLALMLLRRRLRARHAATIVLAQTTFLVLLPKDAGKDEGREATYEDIKARISVAESLFSTVGGLKAERGLRTWLRGPSRVFSFEIVAHQGVIAFYVVVPEDQKGFMEQQIHAQYPDAVIQEVPSYNIFSPQSEIAAATLNFTRSFAFPIKTFRKTDSDPLNALTNSLSKVREQDSAVIQVVATSAAKGWHRIGSKIASKMQQGMKPSQAIREATGNPVIRAISRALALAKTDKKSSEGMSQQPEQYRLSPMEEEMAKGLEEKASKAGVRANIRVLTSSAQAGMAERYLDDILRSFSQYSIYEYGNSFRVIRPKSSKELATAYMLRRFRPSRSVILNTEELASLYHFPLPTTETPNIRWLGARKAPPPVNMPTEGIILGEAFYRGKRQVVRMKEADRRRHTYIIGKSGTGKSNLMAYMARQDIANGKGLAVLDPHGDLVQDVLEGVPKERAEDVILFEPADLERPMGLNMLEARGEEQKDFAVQEMIAIFYKLFPPEMIGPMFEHNMRNVMLTLMADPDNPGTIAEIPRMFTDPEYQKARYEKVTDPVVRAFWEKEMAQTSDFHKSEMLGYLISKVGRFVENEMMRNIIGQPHSSFSFREIMDKNKILLVNLSKGKTGEVNSDLLGMIIVSKLQMAALARADMPEAQRSDFYLYIDEFQNFVTDSIATILSEARKYKLNLIMGHQYMAQLEEAGGKTEVRDAVLGNAGTMLSYRIGVEDAEVLEKEFAPVFNAFDLVNVEEYTVYIKLLIDNTAAKPFSMKTYPLPSGNAELAAQIRELSRLKYGRDRAVVEAEILEQSKLGESSPTQQPTPPEPSL